MLLIFSFAQLSEADFASMMSNITVNAADEVPFISHTTIPFSTLGSFDTSVPNDDDHDVLHITAHKLAHLLFDNYVDHYGYGLSASQRKQFNHRIRRDRLTEFLSALIPWDTSAYENVTEDTPDAPEHLAIVDLSTHNIESAIQHLKENKNNHLALLVSQLDQAEEAFQEDMSTQIKDWSEQNIMSEMSEPVRALYAILSANTSMVKGKATGPLEDRSSTFTISERFNLNWLQAFGLTLWYGKNKNGSIEDSIIEFEGKLAGGEEPATPTDNNGKEDILWVLLKLYASRKGQMARPLLPQAIADSSIVEAPMDSYYAFVLHHALVANLCNAGEVAVDSDAADQLAADLAFELSSSIAEGKEKQAIVGALFALLHIEDAEAREASVRDLLNRFAAYLPEDTTPLTTQLKLPPAWIWEAKAQYARSGHDCDTELQCLVEAKLYEQAHECLCRRIAPTLVIDEDWAGLETALSLFPERAAVKDWASGGAVYALFVQAIGNPEQADLDALQSALVEMGRMSKTSPKMKNGEKLGIEELRERIAVKEMSRVVAGLLCGAGKAAAVLALPVTSDVRLKETRALAVEYYRGVMAR